MKKITVLVDLYYLKVAVAGIGSYIREFEASCNDHGSNDFKYVFTHDINKLVGNSIFLNSNNKIIRWIFQFRYLIYKQIQLPLKILFSKADFVICPDYIAPYFTFKAKRITVLHDSLFWDHKKNYSFLWNKYFISLIKLGINKGTQIITTSNYSKKNLIKILGSDKSINSVYQSFNFLKTSSTIYKTPENYVLHIGSFERRKDLITLVKAFKLVSHPNLKLVLAGAQIINGNSEVLDQIKTFIVENKLKSKVILAGYVSKEEASVLYKNARIYVFPSLDEGFGIPILEALSFSLPVICSDIDVFKEIGGDCVEYFKVGDSKSLSNKISSILKSENLKQKNNTKHLNKFSRKNFIKGFEEIILDSND
ncbi:glycosyltransferase family 1 protein [Flavobacteriaceae bacterium]|nr:glycosyltransferase family 1 protein [Flavobacteriaceae bacterium]